jgi:uncharacterized SAM-binding protein YcdF (DUF218 family)
MNTHSENKLVKSLGFISRTRVIFWLALSLTFAAVYGYLALRQGYASEFVVQDDGRHHVFWTVRYFDPELLQDDIIADYFQSLAPVGYRQLYRFAAFIGIHPLDFHKILPPVLGLITTAYGFGICLTIFPIPIAGFMATLMVNQHLWLEDNLSSGTPRAFFTPLLFAFLYYFLRKRPILCLISIILQGLFYPICILISSGVLVLRLVRWQDGKVQFPEDKRDYILCVGGLLVGFFCLLPYLVTESEFGSMIDVTTAKTMPEFQEEGRTHFFDENFWDYWLEGGRSGLLGRKILTPATLSFALFFPVVLFFHRYFPLTQKIQFSVRILWQVLITSLSLFLLAHLLLFKLYLPSRYTQYTFSLILAFASAIVLTVVFQRCLIWIKNNHFLVKLTNFTLIVSIFIAVVFYPCFMNQFPQPEYQIGKPASLYNFFAQKPKDILIASLTPIADNIPSFSQRSVLVSRETAIPLYPEYYQVIKQRITDLIQAQYSPNLEDAKKFVQKYDVDFWLINQAGFSQGYLEDNDWLQQFQPVTQVAQANLEKGLTPAILNLTDSCSVWRQNKLIVLETKCIREK